MHETEMYKLNSKERVLTAVQHKEPDRVPLFYRDVPEVNARLLKELNLPDSEALMRHLDIDFRWVAPEYVGPSLGEAKSSRIKNILGVEFYYVPFSDSGGYWEAAAHPLADWEEPAALDDYPWPSPDWFDYSTLKDQIKKHENYAIMTAPGYATPGVLDAVQSLCGVEKAWGDMLINPKFFEALVQKLLDFYLPFVEKMLEAAGGKIDFFRVGDDFGTQRAPLIAPEVYRGLMKPALKALTEVAKRHGAYCYLHSCGAVRPLISELIDTGFDVLDPLQVKAAGMVPSELKAEFGERLCFSGGVDEQELLPKGTSQQVKEGVYSLLDVMAPGGGFFIGPTHNFQVDIPTENIVAMYEAARDWP